MVVIECYEGAFSGVGVDGWRIVAFSHTHIRIDGGHTGLAGCSFWSRGAPDIDNRRGSFIFLQVYCWAPTMHVCLCLLLYDTIRWS